MTFHFATTYASFSDLSISSTHYFLLLRDKDLLLPNLEPKAPLRPHQPSKLAHRKISRENSLLLSAYKLAFPCDCLCAGLGARCRYRCRSNIGRYWVFLTSYRIVVSIECPKHHRNSDSIPLGCRWSKWRGKCGSYYPLLMRSDESWNRRAVALDSHQQPA